MSFVLGVLSYLALAAVGCVVARLPEVRRMPRYGKLAAAITAGALIIPLVLALLSAVHVRWSPPLLISAALAITMIGALATRGNASFGEPGPVAISDVSSVVVLLLATYAALSARMTCGDLEFFWAPKGIRFYRAGGIDVRFLRNPDYFLMHADYPPLLPLLYAWSNTITRQFAWFAAVFSSVLFLACIVGFLRATSRDPSGSLFAAAVLGYVFVHNYVGGCADPVLLLFAAVAICSLTFLPEGASQTTLTAVGMAGAVWTKVEGAAFMVAVVGAVMLVRPRLLRKLPSIMFPAVALLCSWLLFVRHENLLDSYRGATKSLYLAALPDTSFQLIQHARADALWLPWVAPIILIFVGPNRRRALLPVAVTLLTLTAAVYFYIREPDQATRRFWIDSSANRTLLLPLLGLCIGAVAAGHAPTRLDPASMGSDA